MASDDKRLENVVLQFNYDVSYMDAQSYIYALITDNTLKVQKAIRMGLLVYT